MKSLSASRLLAPALMCLALAIYALPVHSQSAVVKKSNSDICHPPHSSYYERTKNFRPFQTLQACLDSGSRLPANLSRLTESRAPSACPTPTNRIESVGYDRSRFGYGWDDVDGDCQDSRAEALISASTTTVRFADSNRCRVTTGRWISPFTGEVIQNSSDIDQVVPLKWAWDRGAADWTQSRREEFANDPANLIPVEASLNRSKAPEGLMNGFCTTQRCQKHWVELL